MSRHVLPSAKQLRYTMGREIKRVDVVVHMKYRLAARVEDGQTIALLASMYLKCSWMAAGLDFLALRQQQLDLLKLEIHHDEAQ